MDVEAEKIIDERLRRILQAVREALKSFGIREFEVAVEDPDTWLVKVGLCEPLDVSDLIEDVKRKTGAVVEHISVRPELDIRYSTEYPECEMVVAKSKVNVLLEFA